MTTTSDPAPTSSYERITARILAHLQAGVVPWRQPWTTTTPANLTTRTPYRGINTLILVCEARTTPWWLTYRQAISLGGNVRRGEKGTPIVFFKPFTRDDIDSDGETTSEEPDTRRRFVLRTYTVFNADQCDLPDGLVPESTEREQEPITACERVIAGMPNPPCIHRGGHIAAYAPASDRVSIPRAEAFRRPEDYYATLFHELGHATGHPTRLNRPAIATPTAFGTPEYSHEELVAEITSAFLCGDAGIAPSVEQASAAYLAGWIGALAGDTRMVVIAAAQAQKAADLVLGRDPS
jgi:antirestriction protein ArdC